MRIRAFPSRNRCASSCSRTTSASWSSRTATRSCAPCWSTKLPRPGPSSRSCTTTAPRSPRFIIRSMREPDPHVQAETTAADHRGPGAFHRGSARIDSGRRAVQCPGCFSRWSPRPRAGHDLPRQTRCTTPASSRTRWVSPGATTRARSARCAPAAGTTRSRQRSSRPAGSWTSSRTASPSSPASVAVEDAGLFPRPVARLQHRARAHALGADRREPRQPLADVPRRVGRRRFRFDRHRPVRARDAPRREHGLHRREQRRVRFDQGPVLGHRRCRFEEQEGRGQHRHADRPGGPRAALGATYVGAASPATRRSWCP
jgi:hypothetical protein